MEEIILNAQQRDAKGKQVKHLRRQGLVPAVVYGHHTAPVSLQVVERELRPALHEAGANRLITLTVEGGAEPKRVLTREVQRDSISHNLLHVDFYEVIMTERITAEIPVVLFGESPLVKSGEGFLFQGLDTIEIECLPGDLPAEVRINLSELTTVDQAVLVRNLNLGDAVEILTDLDDVVVKILPPEVEEEPVAAVEAAPTEVEIVGKKEKAEAEEQTDAAAGKQAPAGKD